MEGGVNPRRCTCIRRGLSACENRPPRTELQLAGATRQQFRTAAYDIPATKDWKPTYRFYGQDLAEGALTLVDAYRIFGLPVPLRLFFQPNVKAISDRRSKHATRRAA